MNYTINISGQTYEILDALNNITLADSFVKNKLGGGHGEAKLYVGNENTRFFDFFDDLERDCFFIKEDFSKYLEDARDEFFDPQQDYVRKSEMKDIYRRLEYRLRTYTDGMLLFRLKRVDVEPPRVYLRSDSEYYDFMRALGLPNISYLSILKIKNSAGNILYYCRMFVDYKSDLIKYQTLISKQEEEDANAVAGELSKKKKETIFQARIGQGEYRRKVLEDCQFCPFTLVNDERLLIASHIKPWARSNDREKVDFKNGFALTPTYDKLFDNGFITFQDDKTVSVSPWLSPMNQKRLNIYDGMKLPRLQLDEERCRYLEYHRKHIFKG